jgi:hypothetical protein
VTAKTALVTIAKDVEIAAEDALHFVQKAESETPQVAGALGVVLAAVGKALADAESIAGAPAQALSVTFDQQVLADLKAVWPDVVAFATTFGVKL